MQRIWLLAVLIIGMLGCSADVQLGDPAETESLTFDFSNGDQGWSAGFSDFNQALEASFRLQQGVRTLPGSANRQGFYLSGDSRNDDLFMYIKSRFRGLEPSTRYQADVRLELLSNSGANCETSERAAGESVYVKFGYAEQEPQQDGYFLSIDKGDQNFGGSNAEVLGHIAIEGIACDGSQFGSKVLTSNAATRITFTTTDEGRIWLFIGVDSNTLGVSEVYLSEIEISVRPV